MDLAAEAELVVSELVANAVMHGWGRIGLRLAQSDGGLLVEVEDRHLTRFGASVHALEAFLAEQGYHAATPPDFLPNNRWYVQDSRLQD
jgi:anti-sigma regulatory factor (Ser/Thr protein kinase)